jgi:hypothetical protein
MLSMQEVNILGQILNDTYGASSTVVSPTCSIKYTLQGDVIIFTYSTICNIVMGINPRDQVRKQEEESIAKIKEKIKSVEDSFKAVAGRKLGLKEIMSDDSIEMISMSPHNPKRTAYYRRKTSCKIGG